MREQNIPIKLAITGKTLAGLAGQVFKDGPYEYRIYVKTGELGDETIVSISIFIENTPSHVGVDLYLMALNRVAEVAGDHIEKSEWMINKVIIEQYEALGEMTPMITGQRSNIFGLQSYRSLEEKIRANLSKSINFQEVNDIIDIRKRKLTKVLNYMQKTLPTANKQPLQITYTISGEAKRHNEEILAPSIKADINVTMMEKPKASDHVARSIIEAVKDSVYEMIQDLLPIDIHSYDNITVKVS